MHATSPRPARSGSTVATHAPTVRHLRGWFTARAADTAREELAPLVGAAADLDHDDAVAIARIRGRAHEVTARLAAAGQLPPHLVVGPEDPFVVVERTLAAAWRGITPGTGRERQLVLP